MMLAEVAATRWEEGQNIKTAGLIYCATAYGQNF